MTLKAVDRSEFAREMGLSAQGEAIGARGIADLLRRPLARWGLSPRRAVLRYARKQLEAAGLAAHISSSELSKLLDRLRALGECEEVFVGHERYVAPALPRWIPTSTHTGILLSVGVAPPGVVVLDPTTQEDVARRIRVASDEDWAALHLGEVQCCELVEWLTPLGFLRHMRRRRDRLVRDDEVSLNGFWELLVQSLASQGHLLSDDAQVRFLAGTPGSYFGGHGGAELEGRWAAEVEDGTWCAYRRGYGDAHWHPILVAVAGGERRALDLYDHDEWRWALLARGRAMGVEEQIDRTAASVHLSFPLPAQLAAAMDLLGARTGAWSWEVAEGSPDLWSLIR